MEPRAKGGNRDNRLMQNYIREVDLSLKGEIGGPEASVVEGQLQCAAVQMRPGGKWVKPKKLVISTSITPRPE